MKTYVVYARAGYYPPDSDIATDPAFAGCTLVPRAMHATIEAVSSNDACAKLKAWWNDCKDDLLIVAERGRAPVFETVAVTEVVPTHAELLEIAQSQQLDWDVSKLNDPMRAVRAAKIANRVMAQERDADA